MIKSQWLRIFHFFSKQVEEQVKKRENELDEPQEMMVQDVG